MKKINKKTKLKGFTLIEILITIGLISLATVGTYVVFGLAQDTSNSNEEATQLSNAITRLDRATSASGVYTGVTKETLDSLGNPFYSKFNLTGIVSPTPNKLHINYTGMSNRNCAKFISKMISSSGNVSAIVNGSEQVGGADVGSISSLCADNENAVTIVLTSNISVAGLGAVVPSTPPAAPPPPPPPPPPGPPVVPPVIIPPVVVVPVPVTPPPPPPPVIPPNPPPVVVVPIPTTPPPPPVIPPTAPPPIFVPPPAPLGGGAGGSQTDPDNFTFGGLGTIPGSASKIVGAISGTWSAGGGKLSYVGNIGTEMGVFSRECSLSIYDDGNTVYNLSSNCGSGSVNVTVNYVEVDNNGVKTQVKVRTFGNAYMTLTHPKFSGSLSGPWNENGSGGGGMALTLNPGFTAYKITRQGDPSRVVLMEPGRGFSGDGMGNDIVGKMNGRGNITFGDGLILATGPTGSQYGTTYVNGEKYALGGQLNNFYAVDASGVIATAAVQSVTKNDPGWRKYFKDNFVEGSQGDFDSILFVGGQYIPGMKGPNAYDFGHIQVTTP